MSGPRRRVAVGIVLLLAVMALSSCAEIHRKPS